MNSSVGRWRLVLFFLFSGVCGWAATSEWPLFTATDQCPIPGIISGCVLPCARAPLGGFWECRPTQWMQSSEPTTPVSNVLVQSVGWTSNLFVRFNCRSSQPAKMTFRLGTLETTVSAKGDGSIQQVQAAVTPGLMWSIVFAPEPSTVFASCQISLIDNVTLPNLPGLQAYVALLLGGLDQKVSAVAALDNAATLPAKWTVVRGLEQALQNSLLTKNAQLAAYQGEAKAIEAVDPSKRTAEQNVRETLLTAPGQLIDALQLEIANLSLLKSQLAEAMPETDACTAGGADPVFCLKKVSEAKDAIAKVLDEDFRTAAQVLQFLNGETQRLHGRAADAEAALKKLVDQLNAKLAGKADGV